MTGAKRHRAASTLPIFRVQRLNPAFSKGIHMDSKEFPQIMREFLAYHKAVMGHADKTVEEYALDLRLFFRWLLRERGLHGDAPFEEIDVKPVDVPLLRTVTRTDIYGFLSFLQQERIINPGSAHQRQGLSPVSYARKEATLRSFFR